MLFALSGPVLGQPSLLADSEARLEAACAALARLQLPELAAIEPSWLPAGTASPAGDASDRDVAPLPAHCRVRAEVVPAIRFEVWLPATAEWNGRFLGLGNEDAGGSIDDAALAGALAAGYAAAATDTGHAGNDSSWMADDGLLRDFGYRAIYEMTAKAGVIVTSFYARPADWRYFNGCSNGGRQALMEAERFPADYDGIVAGSPLNAFVAASSTELWMANVVDPGPGGPALDAAALTLLANAATNQCDTLDGVADGLIEDPRRCNFDPRRLQCGLAPAGQCLRPDQIAVATQIYAGPVTQPSAAASQGSAAGIAGTAAVPGAATVRGPFGVTVGAPNRPDLPLPGPAAGAAAATATNLPPQPARVELPGLAVGSEAAWTALTGDALEPLTLAFYRRAVLDDPLWDWRRFDLAIDHPRAMEGQGWMLDANSADLTSFRDSGGKLLIYQGWNDSRVAPQNAIAYYESLESALALAANPRGIATGDFARLFMVPGMAHCGSGGTSVFDAQRAIEDWVERGIAPERIEAEQIEDGTVIRTRPLCPYPQTARYRGQGNSDRSGSFVCGN